MISLDPEVREEMASKQHIHGKMVSIPTSAMDSVSYIVHLGIDFDSMDEVLIEYRPECSDQEKEGERGYLGPPLQQVDKSLGMLATSSM